MYLCLVAEFQNLEEGEIVTGEKRQEWLEKFAKAVLNATQEFTSPGDQCHKGSGTRLRENIEKSSGLKTFHVDGMDIVAFTLEEAQIQRKQIQ